MNTTTVPKSRRLDDAAPSFGERLARLRPASSLQWVTIIVLLALLAGAAVAIGHGATWHPDFDRIVKTIQTYWEYDRS